MAKRTTTRLGVGSSRSPGGRAPGPLPDARRVGPAGQRLWPRLPPARPCRPADRCTLRRVGTNGRARTSIQRPHRLFVAPSKSDKSRYVPLNPAGVALFQSLTAGRAAGARMFSRADGEAWGKNHQQRPMIEACKRAKIVPALRFHELRHTYASTLAQAGADLLTISKLLGHADTRVTARHYAHLCDTTLAKAVKAHLPDFGVVRAVQCGRDSLTPRMRLARPRRRSAAPRAVRDVFEQTWKSPLICRWTKYR